MKLWKIAGAVSGTVFLAAAAGLVLCRTETADREERAGRQEEAVAVMEGGKPPPMDSQEELRERLGGFAEVLYQYDTDERKFYEGAEAFMTDKASRCCARRMQPEERTGRL